LTRYAETRGLAIEGLDHPHGKIDVDPPLLMTGSGRSRKIQVIYDAFAVVELLVKLLPLSIILGRHW
jgi:hypothetical protein